MSYIQHQTKADMEYAAAYDAWLDAMTPDERAEIERKGLGRADVSRKSHIVARDHDAGEDGVTQALEPAEESPIAPSSPATDTLDMTRIIIAELIAAQNLRLSIHALAYAAGMSICSQWRSQSDAAKSIGVQRQSLRKAVRRWEEMLDLPPNIYTTTKERRRKLSEVHTNNHWRNRAFVAPKA